MEYIPPKIVDGKPVVRVKLQAMRKMEQNWDNTLMLFTPDQGVAVPNVRRYVRAAWTSFTIKRITKHTDGYFLIQCLNAKDLNNILEKETFFMNKRPLVVKH